MQDLAPLLELRRRAYPTVPLISFSHFLPLQSLLPEKRFLFSPNLAKAVGSDFLEARVRALDADIHCFGHTHFSWDSTENGTLRAALPRHARRGEAARGSVLWP
ncbi:calcineurin-like phosphoesterase [Aureococcus anophagefferens]|nr:calcineurin-like phosphoesterase [Aureococcus anophagefferens]